MEQVCWKTQSEQKHPTERLSTFTTRLRYTRTHTRTHAHTHTDRREQAQCVWLDCKAMTCLMMRCIALGSRKIMPASAMTFPQSSRQSPPLYRGLSPSEPPDKCFLFFPLPVSCRIIDPRECTDISGVLLILITIYQCDCQGCCAEAT